MEFEIGKIRDSKPEILKETYTPLAVSRIMRKNGLKTAKKAFKQTDISLAKLRKEFGEEIVQDYLTKWLLNLNKFMFRDMDKMQSRFQIEELAQIIQDEYYYFNIIEIALCFNCIKSGKFGKMYGELTGQYILEGFEQYRRLRLKGLQEIENDKTQSYIKSLYAAEKVQARYKLKEAEKDDKTHNRTTEEPHRKNALREKGQGKENTSTHKATAKKKP